MCEFGDAWVWWWRWWSGQQLSWHRAGGCREIGSRKKGRAVHWNTTTHQYYCLLPNTFWIMHNCNTICSLDHILKKRLKAGIRWQVLDRLIFLKPKKNTFAWCHCHCDALMDLSKQHWQKRTSCRTSPVYQTPRNFIMIRTQDEVSWWQMYCLFSRFYLLVTFFRRTRCWYYD